LALVFGCGHDLLAFRSHAVRRPRHVTSTSAEGDPAPMRIRTHTFVTLDGHVSTPDGRPIQLLLPGFPGTTAYGLPEFLASCEAVLMGRTTFLPALEAPDWPWTQPVFVLTSRPLPEGTPDHVTTAPTPAALLKAMETAGVTGDVHLVGGPRTMQAFREIGALAEVGLLVIPRIQGGGVPLAPPGTEPLSLTLRSTRTFPDGVIEARYTP
jgi:dihydrofolate reductase